MSNYFENCKKVTPQIIGSILHDQNSALLTQFHIADIRECLIENPKDPHPVRTHLCIFTATEKEGEATNLSSLAEVGWSYQLQTPVCLSCFHHFDSLRRWKHHCRACGLFVCSVCSTSSIKLENYESYGSQRVCNGCYNRQEKGVVQLKPNHRMGNSVLRFLSLDDPTKMKNKTNPNETKSEVVTSPKKSSSASTTTSPKSSGSSSHEQATEEKEGFSHADVDEKHSEFKPRKHSRQDDDPSDWIASSPKATNPTELSEENYLQHKKALADIRAKMKKGSSDEIVLISPLKHLSIVCTHLRKYEEAEKVLTELLSIQRKVNGHEHDETLVTIWQLGNIYVILSRFSEASLLYEEYLKGIEQGGAISETNSLVYETKSLLGRVYTRLSYYSAAELNYKESIRIMKSVLGADHEKTLEVIDHLGTCYYDQAKFTEALSYYLECYEGRLRTLGERHKDTITVMGMLAGTYYITGKPNEGIELCEKCLQLSIEVLGEDHPDTIQTKENLNAMK